MTKISFTNKKNIYLLLLLLSLQSINANGQDSLKSKPKNVIYANLGTFGLWFTAGINYERQLFSINNKFYSNYYIRSCTGAYTTWGAGGPFGSISLQGVWGKNNSHLELGLGLAALFDRVGYRIGISNSNYPYTGYEPEPLKLDYTTITPTANLGYRYQKQSSGFILRTGIDFPIGIYLSLGYAF